MLQESGIFSEESKVRQVLAVRGEAGRKLLYAHGYDIGEGFIDVQSQYQSLRDAARSERLRDLSGLLVEMNKKPVVLSVEYKSALDGLLVSLEGEKRLVGNDVARRAATEAGKAGSGAITMLFAKLKLDDELKAGTDYLMERILAKVNGRLGEEGEKNLRLVARRAAAGEMLQKGMGRETMGEGLRNVLGEGR